MLEITFSASFRDLEEHIVTNQQPLLLNTVFSASDARKSTSVAIEGQLKEEKQFKQPEIFPIPRAMVVQ